MISGLRQNPCKTSFGRDISYDECDALQKRDPQALFEVGYKIGTREIRLTDGALDTIDIRTYTPYYKRSADAKFFNPNICQEHTSESYLQVIKTLLQTPIPEKKSVTADVMIIRGFAAGYPKNIAQSGFCLGGGAFDPRQVAQAIKDFRQGGLMAFKGTVDAFRALEEKTKHLQSLEPTKLQLFMSGLMHNFRA